ncbi:MAG: hypothetical protein V7632_1337 [Bradyrhizobium sp.]|jgi:hypothetical protein
MQSSLRPTSRPLDTSGNSGYISNIPKLRAVVRAPPPDGRRRFARLSQANSVLS